MERARGFAGKSKAAISLALGVDRKTIYNWETGATYPPVDKLLQFARLTEFPMSFFIDGLDGDGGGDGGVTHRKPRLRGITGGRTAAAPAPQPPTAIPLAS